MIKTPGEPGEDKGVPFYAPGHVKDQPDISQHCDAKTGE
jgi:hypothetical protein